jgi:flagellar protein FlgJ
MADGILSSGVDAAVSAKQARDTELVQLKQQVDRLKNDITPGATKQQKLRKACTDFEAVFISKLYDQMRATVPKSGLFTSQQSEMYRSIFDRDFAEKLAGDGGIGLGDMLYEQLKNKLKNVKSTTKGSDAADAGQPYEIKALKMPKRSVAATDATQQGAAATQSAGLPESVSGDVMPDVEALANRIEADFARRQGQAQTSGVSGYSSKAATTGRKLAIVG